MAIDSEIGLPGGPAPPEQAFGPYLRAIRRHWVLVGAITLVTAVIATITVIRSNPSYQASATLLVSPVAQGDPNFASTGVITESGEPARTIQTAAALVNSLPAAQQTAKALGHGATAGGVQSSISVSPRGQSDVLEVTAQSGSAAQAVLLANTFAREAVAYRGTVVSHNIDLQIEQLNARLKEISGTGLAETNLAQQLATRIAALRSAQAGGGDPTVSVSGLAVGGGSSTGAPHWLIVILSLIGGFAIGSVAALAVEFFNRSVGDIDEIETLFPVLATVPKVARGGRGGTIRPSAFPPAAFEQVRMLRVQLSKRERAPVIMLTSADPGDGKTTLAAALAASFAEAGEKVILIDFDLRKPDLARLLGLERRRSTSLVDRDLDDLLVDVPDLPGVRALPAGQVDPTQFAPLLARLPLLLDEAVASADRVVVDAAPVGAASETIQIAALCDQIVLAVRPRHTDRQRLVTAADMLARAGASVVGVVATQSSVETGGYGYGYGYGYSAADQPTAGDAISMSATPARSHGL